MQPLQERIEGMADVIRAAKVLKHLMGTWHYIDADTVQSRCIFCNAGIVVGKQESSFGLDEPCLYLLSEDLNLIRCSSAGCPVNYD